MVREVERRVFSAAKLAIGIPLLHSRILPLVCDGGVEFAAATRADMHMEQLLRILILLNQNFVSTFYHYDVFF